MLNYYCNNITCIDYLAKISVFTALSFPNHEYAIVVHLLFFYYLLTMFS